MFWFGFFFEAQLAFKQAKFYFWFQNDHAKRVGPSWAVTSFTEVILRVFNHWRRIWHFLYLLFMIRRVRKHKTRYSLHDATLSNLDPFFLLRGLFESRSKIAPVWTLKKNPNKIFFLLYISERYVESKYEKKTTHDIYISSFLQYFLFFWAFINILTGTLYGSLSFFALFVIQLHGKSIL